MTLGELLTRGTIWLAVILYALGLGSMLARPLPAVVPRRFARLAWTLGCAMFATHVLCAFTYYHGWSHAAAYAETARQTEQMTGFQCGAGLYLNYAFGLAWLGMVVWWWAAPRAFNTQPRWLNGLWNGFALFMIFNGTVVFGRGAARWLGIAIYAGLLLAWTMGRRAMAKPLP
jgi:hypothetical protein